MRRFASHRARVNQLYSAFLCDPFEGSSQGLPSATDECSSNPDLSTRCGCASCHETIEPVATYWGRWSEGNGFQYTDNREPFVESCATCEKGSCSSACKTYYVTRELETTPGSVDDQLGMLKVLAWRGEDGETSLEAGPAALVSRPEYEAQLAECAVRNFAEYVFGRSLSASERVGWLRERARNFASADHNFLAMVKDIVMDEKYRRIE